MMHLARTVICPPAWRLRFINFCLYHACDLDCSFCKVPKQKVKTMPPEIRKEAFRRLALLAAPVCKMSILGGEPTLRPQLLLEAVEDAAIAGFLPNVVSNGYALTEDLIRDLARAGLDHLAISVDVEAKGALRANLDKALSLLQVARSWGIAPVINVLVSRSTDVEQLKHFCQKVFDAKCFISLLVMSPNVGGMFSSASQDDVPTNEQLREIVGWLKKKKAANGLTTSTFGYLNILSEIGQGGKKLLWHCSSHFRSQQAGSGRGFLFMDSDGQLGPCQEFRSRLNILDMREEHLSLKYLDEEMSRITAQCLGCTYNCYIMEEELRGLKALEESPTALRLVQIKVSVR